ncbi:hypothetical protein [Vibrio sp. SCSIO 43136]|uniref:hypothetical protein n=1 Tax=Vibrio sp. SCSIO 43136 TaxID=2819101 RepID=UPI00207537D6|nr:hypothetical protein [Vibrio sp. SCSIO 43136]USD68054.1 hypothetical protein J4N39_17930 [Vibrio sp. SCSIO 43136]
MGKEMSHQRTAIIKVGFYLVSLIASGVIGFIVAHYIQFIPALSELLDFVQLGQDDFTNAGGFAESLKGLELKLGAAVLHEYFRLSLYAIFLMLAILVAAIYCYYQLSEETKKTGLDEISTKLDKQNKKLDSRTEDLISLVEGFNGGGSVLDCEFGYHTMVNAIKNASEIDLVTRMRYDKQARQILGNKSYEDSVKEYYKALSEAVKDPNISFTRYIQIDGEDIADWKNTVSISESLTREAATLFLTQTACEDSSIYVVPAQVDLSLLLIDKKQIFFNFFIKLSDGKYASKYIFQCISKKSKVDSILKLLNKDHIELDSKSVNELVSIRLRHGDDKLREELADVRSKDPDDFDQKWASILMFI